MKSLFKRTLAAASSTVLALSQFATVAANVNISAAADTDTAASSTSVELPVKVDMDYLLNVPIKDELPLVVGEETVWGQSDWASIVSGALMTLDGDKEFVDNLADEKATLKRKLLNAQERIETKHSRKFGCHLDSATVDEILSKISDTAKGTLTTEGKITAEISVDDLGQIAGRLIKEEMEAKYPEKKSVTADWSSLKIAGKIIVEAQLLSDDKKVSYQVTFIDENGKKYTDDKGLEEYALKKLDEIYAILKKAGEDEGKGPNYFETLEADYARAKKDATKVRQFADAVATITGTSEDLKSAYDSYKAKLLEKASSINTQPNDGTIEDKIYD
jgi:ribosomal protein L11